MTRDDYARSSTAPAIETVMPWEEAWKAVGPVRRLPARLSGTRSRSVSSSLRIRLLLGKLLKKWKGPEPQANSPGMGCTSTAWDPSWSDGAAARADRHDEDTAHCGSNREHPNR